MARPAVFLDRDGVINSYVYNPDFGTMDSLANPGEFMLLPGVVTVISQPNGLGLKVSIAKGRFTRKLLDAITEKMTKEIASGGGQVDGVYYCPHHPNGGVPDLRLPCGCRKPSLSSLDTLLELVLFRWAGDGVDDLKENALTETDL